MHKLKFKIESLNMKLSTLTIMSQSILRCYNSAIKSFTLKNVSFDGLDENTIKQIFRDGRAFSHFIEPWIAKQVWTDRETGDKFKLIHVTGCKDHDFVIESKPCPLLCQILLLVKNTTTLDSEKTSKIGELLPHATIKLQEIFGDAWCINKQIFLGCPNWSEVYKNLDKYEIDEKTKFKYDEKTFTGGGCKFMPSNMIGKGRKFDKEVFMTKANDMTYIIVDNTQFPSITIKFAHGSELVKQYPNGSIPFKDREKFFMC